MAYIVTNKTQKPFTLCLPINTKLNGVTLNKTFYIEPLGSYNVQSSDEPAFKDYLKTDIMKMMLDKGFLSLTDKPLKLSDYVVEVESPKPPESLTQSDAQNRLQLQHGIGATQPAILETMHFPVKG